MDSETDILRERLKEYKDLLLAACAILLQTKDQQTAAVETFLKRCEQHGLITEEQSNGQDNDHSRGLTWGQGQN